MASSVPLRLPTLLIELKTYVDAKTQRFPSPLPAKVFDLLQEVSDLLEVPYQELKHPVPARGAATFRFSHFGRYQAAKAGAPAGVKCTIRDLWSRFKEDFAKHTASMKAIAETEQPRIHLTREYYDSQIVSISYSHTASFQYLVLTPVRQKYSKYCDVTPVAGTLDAWYLPQDALGTVDKELSFDDVCAIDSLAIMINHYLGERKRKMSPYDAGATMITAQMNRVNDAEARFTRFQRRVTADYDVGINSKGNPDVMKGLQINYAGLTLSSIPFASLHAYVHKPLEDLEHLFFPDRQQSDIIIPDDAERYLTPDYRDWLVKYCRNAFALLEAGLQIRSAREVYALHKAYLHHDLGRSTNVTGEVALFNFQHSLRNTTRYYSRLNATPFVFLYPMQSSVHAEYASVLWEDLKDHSNLLRENGQYLALALDMTQKSPVFHLEELDCRMRLEAVGEVDDAEGEEDNDDDDPDYIPTQACPRHFFSDEKQACENLVKCILTGKERPCKETAPLPFPFSQEYESWYNGYWKAYGPLLRSVSLLADLTEYGQSGLYAARLFMRDYIEAFELKSESHKYMVASIRFEQYTYTAEKLAALKSVEVIPGVKAVGRDTHTVRIRSGTNCKTVCHLEQVFRYTGDLDILAAKASSRGVQIFPVKVYKSRYTGLTSLDHFAAPRTLRCSLDQARPFYVHGKSSFTGHVASNVDVLPLHAQLAKHTAPPEYIAYLGLCRFLTRVVKPIQALPPATIQLRDQAIADLDRLGRDFARLNQSFPYIRSERVRLLEDAATRERVRSAYEPIIAFGKGVNFEGGLIYEDSQNNQQMPKTVKRRKVKGGEAKVLVSELVDTSPADVLEMLGRDDERSVLSQKPCKYKDPARAYPLEFPALFNTFAAFIQVQIIAMGLILVGVVAVDDIYLIKQFHLWLLLLWCDEEGRWWIALIFIVFWVINIYHLHRIEGRCPIFGMRLTAYSRDHAAFADGHAVHGISMVYKSQKIEQLTNTTTFLEAIDLGLTNLCVESRAANHWRSDFRKRDLLLADQQLLAMTSPLFKKAFKALHESLYKEPGFRAALVGVLESEDMLGLPDQAGNVVTELPLTHKFHPANGNAHYTMSFRKAKR